MIDGKTLNLISHQWFGAEINRNVSIQSNFDLLLSKWSEDYNDT
jgi:hypothetical protein